MAKSIMDHWFGLKIWWRLAAVLIFPGMVVMPLLDWSRGWENRFYSIGVFWYGGYALPPYRERLVLLLVIYMRFTRWGFSNRSLSIYGVKEFVCLSVCNFLRWFSLWSTSFWPPSMAYISIINYTIIYINSCCCS